jgi:hypothetical protein
MGVGGRGAMLREWQVCLCLGFGEEEQPTELTIYAKTNDSIFPSIGPNSPLPYPLPGKKRWKTYVLGRGLYS